MLDGAQLDVSWKKPVDKVAYNQRKQNCQAIFAPKYDYWQKLQHLLQAIVLFFQNNMISSWCDESVGW